MANFTHPILENQIYFITTSTRNREKTFSKPENANIVLEILEELRKAGAAKIYAFVIMPDHLHLIVKPEKESLAMIVQRIKGKSARLINRQEGRYGTLWQREYYERGVRDEADLKEKYNYIIYNPVKSGLVKEPEDYPFSSAALKEMANSP